MMALVLPSRGGHARRAGRPLASGTICWPRSRGSRRPTIARCWPARNQQNGQCASIHDRVVFKQADLDQRIQYDNYPRKSLVDLFYDNEATLDAVAAGQAEVRSDFTQAAYEAKIRRNADRIQVQLVREGQACGVPLRITKGLTLDAGSSTLKIAYLLENLPPDRPLHFAVEMNFAGLPSGADDRYFHDARGQPAGPAWRAARSGRDARGLIFATSGWASTWA